MHMPIPTNKRLRKQAEDIRIRAKKIQDPDSQQWQLEIARTYDRMAKHLEDYEASRKKQ
jgi:hypothetical protein